MSTPIENSQTEHTTAEWASLNPVLALNVIGVEIMSNGYNRYKRGDGVTHWASLPYIDKQYPLADIINAVYPIGSIYMSASSTSPATLFGGTWAQIKGRFLLGTGANEANTSDWWGSFPAGTIYAPAGEMAGQAKHSLTEDELPSHQHYVKDENNGYYLGNSGGISPSDSRGVAYDTTGRGTTWRTDAAGGGGAHNIMPPYLAVYMWKRTA